VPGLGLHSPRFVVVQHAVTAPGTGGLLAQAEDRSAAVVTAWLTAQPQGWRRGITHVAIDLSASYAKAVREGLPDVVLVADRFHIIRLANDTVTAVRQRVIREDQGRRGRKTDPAWRVRRRLLTAHERLRPEVTAKMWHALVNTEDRDGRSCTPMSSRKSCAPCSPSRCSTPRTSRPTPRSARGSMSAPRPRRPHRRSTTPRPGLHPPTPAGASHHHRAARSSAMSLFGRGRPQTQMR